MPLDLPFDVPDDEPEVKYEREDVYRLKYPTGWSDNDDLDEEVPEPDRISVPADFLNGPEEAAGEARSDRGDTSGENKYDRQESARHDLGALETDLKTLSEQLTVVAEQRVDLRRAIQQLIATLREFVDAGPGQPPDLAFSATAQYSALETDINDAAPEDGGTDLTLAPSGAVKRAWESIKKLLSKGWSRLWSLISHLTKVKEWSVGGSIGVPFLGLGQAQISVTFGS
jgi:hypothetical protein